MPSATIPSWAAPVPSPWLSWDANVAARADKSERAVAQTLSASLTSPTLKPALTKPIAVGVPADCEWHRLPDHVRLGGEETHAARSTRARWDASDPSPAGSSTASSRRAARLAREAARSQQAQTARAVEQRQLREPHGPDAVWAARKERIIELISQEEANQAELKRELRRLLAYADGVRSAAREEREALASGARPRAPPRAQGPGSLPLRT
jgi:hypothetical protein